MIAMRKSRKLHLAVDRKLYGLRNLAERCFSKLRNARQVATCYDTTAKSLFGFIDITAIHIWLCHLSSGPNHSAQTCCSRWFMGTFKNASEGRNLPVKSLSLCSPASKLTGTDTVCFCDRM